VSSETVEERAEEKSFRFSVVIPTYQRRDVVLRSVEALCSQDLDAPFEVITIVDGSTDGSAAALRELETPFPLFVVEQENVGRANACNRGAALARGEMLLFLDDDMEADPSLLEQHERSHREGADVVVGHIPLHPDSPQTFLSAAVAAWAEGRAHLICERGGELELDDLLSGQLSLRRDVFWHVGGFDAMFNRSGLYGGEDLDFGRRLLDAGYRVVFNPNAISLQRYVVTPRQYLRQWRQAGRASVLLARAHPDQAQIVFRRHETRLWRLVGQPLRVPLREAVLAAAPLAPRNARLGRWFFRVRNLEFFRGIRDAGGEPARRTVRVVCYHSISDLTGAPILEPYGIPPQSFRRQLEFLARHFRFLRAEEFARYVRGGGVPRRAILLTFDDCYDDLLDAAAPILRELDVPAIAFAVTGLIGRTNEWDVRVGAPQLRLLDAEELHALAESGIAVGSHTRTHRMLDSLSSEEVATEIDGAARDLEALGFAPPFFLSYPHGAHDARVREAAQASGAIGAFTVESAPAAPGGDPYAIPRIEILRGDEGLRFAFKVVMAGRFHFRRPRLLSLLRRADVSATGS
jgi:glycosyltransferase involved in cell wall biosynthesis